MERSSCRLMWCSRSEEVVWCLGDEMKSKFRRGCCMESFNTPRSYTVPAVRGSCKLRFHPEARPHNYKYFFSNSLMAEFALSLRVRYHAIEPNWLFLSLEKAHIPQFLSVQHVREHQTRLVLSHQPQQPLRHHLGGFKSMLDIRVDIVQFGARLLSQLQLFKVRKFPAVRRTTRIVQDPPGSSLNDVIMPIHPL